MAKNQLPTITPRYLLETRRYLLIAVGIGLVTALLLFVGIIPQVQAILELQANTTEQSQKVANLEQKVRQLEQVLSPDLLAQIQTVDSLLPSHKPLLELLTSLNSVAAQAQVSYSGIELSPGSIATEGAQLGNSGLSRGTVATGGSTDADTLEVKLRVQGSLDQLNQFFSLVERTAPISTITALALTPQGRAALLSDQVAQITPGLYEAEVTVDTAYFTKSISAAVNAALPTITADQQAFLSELAQFTIPVASDQQEIIGGGLDDLFGVQQPPTGVRN